VVVKFLKLGALSAILFPAAVFAQKDMSSARPEIRMQLAEKTVRFWTNAEVDTAWVRSIPVISLAAGILISKQDTITTSAAVDQYALNSDFFRIRSVWRGLATNRAPIQIVDDPYSLESVGSTLPSEYCWVHQNRLIVFPIPTGAEKLYVFYYADPILAFATDTTTSDLPKPLRAAVVWEAASNLWNADYKNELSILYHQRAMEIVGRYRALITQQGDRPEEVQK